MALPPAWDAIWTRAGGFSDAEMLMGIGNLTELTDADSAAINVLLLGFCQELGIHSILTTQVINSAHSSVPRMRSHSGWYYHAVHNRTLPKRVEPGLVILAERRGVAIRQRGAEQLAGSIKDHNYRIFAENGSLHAISAGRRWSNWDPFALFFCPIAGRGTAKSTPTMLFTWATKWPTVTALTLDKEYRQDEAPRLGVSSAARASP